MATLFDPARHGMIAEILVVKSYAQAIAIADDLQPIPVAGLDQAGGRLVDHKIVLVENDRPRSGRSLLVPAEMHPEALVLAPCVSDHRRPRVAGFHLHAEMKLAGKLANCLEMDPAFVARLGSSDEHAVFDLPRAGGLGVKRLPFRQFLAAKERDPFGFRRRKVPQLDRRAAAGDQGLAVGRESDDGRIDRKSTRLNSSHVSESRMP